MASSGERKKTSQSDMRRIEGKLSLATIGLFLIVMLLVYHAKMGSAATGLLNLNTAAPEQIAATLGISQQDAALVAAYRERLGGFEHCEQVLSTPFAAPRAAAGQPASPRKHLLDAEHVRPQLKKCAVREASAVFWRFWGLTLLFAAVMLFLPPLLRSRATGDPYIVPVALLLTGFGAAMLFSVKDPLRESFVAMHHLSGALVASVVMLIFAWQPVKVRQRLRRWQYVWVIAAFTLVFALLLFGSGPEGVKLNLFHFQPVELIKLFLIIFLASALAERADLIADSSPPAAKAENGGKALQNALQTLLPRREDFAPMSVMFAGALVMFLVIKDMGPGLLMFASFVALVYMLTGKTRFLAAGAVLIFVGGFLGWKLHACVFPTRVDMWLAPFDNVHPNGMQLGEGIWAMASSGWRGSGLGYGMPGLIPRGGSDLAFASWAEETGILGALLVLALFALLIWRGIKIAVDAANPFDRALAAGITVLLGLQTLIIVAGVTGMFPLSGIALPFLSYGNSALVSAAVSIGLLRGISATGDSSKHRLEIRPESAAACRLFAGAMAVLFIGIIGIWRLGTIQVLRSPEYAVRPIFTPDADKVRRAHVNPRLLAVATAIQRGSIYDRNGQILATSREQELAHYFTAPGVATARAANQIRFYPFGAATSNVVGYLDAAVGGPFGLEKTYNSQLRGFARYADLLTDYRDRFGRGYHPRKGLDLHLTIDARLQTYAVEALQRHAAQLRDASTGRAKDRGGFVLMDPTTGEVLIAATSPGFDPNALTPDKMRQFTSGDDSRFEHRFVDRSRFGYYPPGSTMKVATAACALDTLPDALQFHVTANHVADPIKWQANGKWYIRKHVREDEGDPAFGTLDMRNALRVSSNIYFANLAAAIGSNPLHDTLANRFGFSHVPKQEQFDADLPDIGYGQGRMLASPLEMCRIASMVANKGMLPDPHLLTSTTFPGAEADGQDAGNILPTDPVDRPQTYAHTSVRALTEPSALRLQEYMGNVVTSGTARGIFTGMPFEVAGKTGSAQNHQYDKKAHSWFIGFAPYSNASAPRWAFACVVENGGYGRQQSAPICRDILRKLK